MSTSLLLLCAPLLAPQVGTAPSVGRANGGQHVAPAGRVLWRYSVPSTFIHHRPALGPDGTIYVNDIDGIVHAIAPDGQQRWTFDLQGLGAQGPCAVGSDGTVYVVGDPGGLDVNLYALNPDGSTKWVFNDVGAQGVIAGPAVGPDGNVYVTTEFPGSGLISLTPAGGLRFASQPNPGFFENGQLGAELAFGSSTPGGRGDRVFMAFDMIGMGTGPRLFGYDLGGGAKFSVATGGQIDPFLQPQSQPVGGPDGRVWVASNRGPVGWSLEAFDPDTGTVESSYTNAPANGMSPPTLDGAGNAYVVRSLSFLVGVSASGQELWTWFDGSILYGPVVSPDGTQLLLGGRPNFGQPGFLRAFSTQGKLLWNVDLGLEGAGALTPDSRATFAPSGTVAYITVTNPSGSSSAPSYVYALDMRP